MYIGLLVVITVLFHCSEGVALTSSRSSAVVVGGGPVGLATALALEKLGWKDITVIEKRSSDFFESARAYLYLIDKRGQRCTDLLGLTSATAKQAVSSLEYPGLNEVLTTGEIRVKKLPTDGIDNEKYWIPRAEFLRIFQDRIKDSPSIRMLFSTACDIIECNADGRLCLSVSNIPDTQRTDKEDRDTSASQRLYADLIVGADGINSMVRTWLANPTNAATTNNHEFFMQTGADRTRVAEKLDWFEPVRLPSDSAGLKYKMLTLKYRFPLPVYRGGDKKQIKSKGPVGLSSGNDAATATATATSPAGVDSGVTGVHMLQNAVLSVPEEKYAIRSVGKTATTRLSLGLLSVRGTAKRTANIICRPDHRIWQLKTPSEVRNFLSQSFPQIDLASFVEEGEIERFARQEPGEFPMPQYVRGLYALFGRASSRTNTSTNANTAAASPADKKDNIVSGVVLAGDSIHAFPPDLGQGVNSGLEDVYTFYHAMKNTSNDMKTALPLYESLRQPEAIALCKLMQFGWPYQYNQAPFKAKLGLMNFAVRLLLNKILPWMFDPPAFMMVMKDHTQSYAKILHRAHRTTRRITALFAFVMLLIVKAALPLPGTLPLPQILRPMISTALSPSWLPFRR